MRISGACRRLPALCTTSPPMINFQCRWSKVQTLTRESTLRLYTDKFRNSLTLDFVLRVLAESIYVCIINDFNSVTHLNPNRQEC